MTLLASPRWRLFAVAWLLYAVHFATNVVRDHYPAFALAEHGTLRVDEYQGFHPDIFVHRDGHSYVGNNVAVSVLAAGPLLLFDPVLDALEAHSKRRLAASPDPPEAVYRTEHANRRAFFKLVTDKGLGLRFGAATMVTSLFLMAPLSALMVVLMFHILAARGVERRLACGLALLFGFGTPVFFRTSSLSHNMFLLYATFLAFHLLWVRPGDQFPVPLRHRVAAGGLAGFALAADYSGIVPLLALYMYLLLARLGTAAWRTSFRESLAFVAGSVAPIGFLLYSQWAMYGNPFLPGQYWMPDVTYTDRGWRGFDWPALDLFGKLLIDPSYGMYAFGPLLLLGLVPAWWYRRETLVLSRRERWLAALFLVAMLVFCAANQYSRMQFNTGFRYLLPVVPFVFLQLADHLVRMPRRWLLAIATVSVAHSWVLTAVREPVLESWRRVLTEGIQLPWLSVLARTSAPDAPVISSPLAPVAVLGLAVLIAYGTWRYGARLEAARATRGR